MRRTTMIIAAAALCLLLLGCGGAKEATKGGEQAAGADSLSGGDLMPPASEVDSLPAGAETEEAPANPTAAPAQTTEEPKETAMTYTSISQAEAHELLQTRTDLILVDVREQYEYDEGHIPGAICIPVGSIVTPPAELPDRAQTILVYCRSGRRSKQASSVLASLGYSNILEFGGILDWPYEVTEPAGQN